jgi:hypothetical protein
MAWSSSLDADAAMMGGARHLRKCGSLFSAGAEEQHFAALRGPDSGRYARAIESVR